MKRKLKKDIEYCKSQKEHVEQAIAQIKDFRILILAFSITMKDLLDNIFLICAASTNLAPPLLHYESK